jgi:hypothetical protein
LILARVGVSNPFPSALDIPSDTGLLGEALLP